MEPKDKRDLLYMWTAVVALFLLFSANAHCACPNTTNGYDHCRKLTVDDAYVAGTANFTNFTVPVYASANWVKSVANGGDFEDGNDLRFELFDETVLDYEVESHDLTNGVLWAWVKIPALYYSAGTDFYLYCGKSGATGEDDPAGTWSELDLVYHMGEDPSGSAPQMFDSVGEANDGTSYGTMLTEDLVTGKLGSALQFDGTNDKIVTAKEALGEYADGNGYVSCWIKYDSVSSNDGIISDRVGISSDYTQLNNAPGGDIRAIMHDGSAEDILTPGYSQSTATWYHLVLTWDSGNAYLYVDGTERASNTTLVDGYYQNTTYFWFGGYYDTASDRYLHGHIDEARIGNVYRTEDWVDTDYALTNAPNSAISIGSDLSAAASTNPVFRIQGIIGTIFWRSAWLLDYWQ